MNEINIDHKFLHKKLTTTKQDYHKICKVICMVKHLLSEEIQKDNKNEDKINEYNKTLEKLRFSANFTQIVIQVGKQSLKNYQRTKANKLKK